MRVVSLVPSWTETLLAAGANVVGRTRYCVHPKEIITDIPIVGGTKKVSFEKIAELNPDLIILDKEENPKELSEGLSSPFWASHILGVSDVEGALRELSSRLHLEDLNDLANRWSKVSGRTHVQSGKLFSLNDNPWEELPGLLSWWKKPETQIDKVLYLIWSRPLMGVSKNTFIGSMLGAVGLGPQLPDFECPYPEIELSQWDPKRTLLLCSTEPFPFEKKHEDILASGFACGLVDGEAYSWYGKRALEFLENSLT